MLWEQSSLHADEENDPTMTTGDNDVVVLTKRLGDRVKTMVQQLKSQHAVELVRTRQEHLDEIQLLKERHAAELVILDSTHRQHCRHLHDQHNYAMVCQRANLLRQIEETSLCVLNSIAATVNE
jgi:hypothetical protein